MLRCNEALASGAAAANACDDAAHWLAVSGLPAQAWAFHDVGCSAGNLDSCKARDDSNAAARFEDPSRDCDDEVRQCELYCQRREPSASLCRRGRQLCERAHRGQPADARADRAANSNGRYPLKGDWPAPKELPYDDERPVPDGFDVVTRYSKGRMLAGAVEVGLPWALGTGIALGTGFPDRSGWLLLPGAGPWLMLAQGGADDRCAADGASCVSRWGLRTVLVLDGIAQASGLLKLGYSIAFPDRYLVRRPAHLTISPTMLGPSAYGGRVGGSF